MYFTNSIDSVEYYFNKFENKMTNNNILQIL